ncbi:MAG: GNAT family N-acetyltransferase [Chloroflexota bacterium]|nr:GNAT family N-acetyltransferase [Chloroflexota bacterium]
MQTQQLTTVSIRPFTADDYSAIARLHSVNFPEYGMDADEWRFDDEHRPAHCRWARWVAEWEGRVIGFAEYDQHPTHYHPRRFMLNLVVDPEFLSRGVGRCLYDRVMADVRALDAENIDAWSREDMPDRVRFFVRRGFVEDMRMWTSELDLTRFDATRFAHLAPAVEAQGIQIRTLSQLGHADPHVQRKLYEMWLEVRRDVPHPPGDEPRDVSFDLYWELHNRPQLLPAGFFVALDGEHYVGMSQLWRSANPSVLRTGLTGVRRAYRRRGIAFALKVRSLEFAHAEGYTRVETENELNNRGMLAINDALGFAKNPAWLHFSKSIYD